MTDTVESKKEPIVNYAEWKPDPNHPRRRPPWIPLKKVKNGEYHKVHGLMRKQALHTVCEEALCPNLGECWGRGTATFLIMGDTCTRSCSFCDVKTGRPSPLDWAEPNRVAKSVSEMKLNHAVITSVTRDERADGGAPIFAMTIKRIRQLRPECSIEVLIPDFKGNIDNLKTVVDAQPEILNHNVETVPRLFKAVQPQDKYEWAMDTLGNAKKIDPLVLTKSGIMVGLGETFDEVIEVMRDLAGLDVDILTVGQYLQPSKKHRPTDRFYLPDEFVQFHDIGKELGFKWVESGPLVRSSYNADVQVRELSKLNFIRGTQYSEDKT